MYSFSLLKNPSISCHIHYASVWEWLLALNLVLYCTNAQNTCLRVIPTKPDSEHHSLMEPKFPKHVPGGGGTHVSLIILLILYSLQYTAFFE